MIIDTGHALALRSNGSSLNLCGSEADGSWWLEAKAQGTDWGNPQAVITSIRSQLLDGSLGAITSYDNRTIPIRLRIVATDAAALADGEAALMAALRWTGLGELIWTPPGPMGPPAVFEVVYGDPQFQFDDFGELQCHRVFIVTLTCRPFAASLRKVLVQAISGAASPTTIDLTTQPGYTTTVTAPDNFAMTRYFNLSPAVNSPGTVFLHLTGTYRMEHGGTYLPTPGGVTMIFIVDGVAITPVTSSPQVNLGSVMGWGAWFQLTTAQASALASGSVTVLTPDSTYYTAVGVTITVASLTDASPFASGFAKTRQFPVYGSMRTEGSVTIKADSTGSSNFSATGGLLVYSAPADVLQAFDPALMQYRTAGPLRTIDTAQTSGSKSTLLTSNGAAVDTFTIDASKLVEGTYALVLRYAADHIVGDPTGNINYSITQVTEQITGSAPAAARSSGRFLILGNTTAPLLRVRRSGASNVVIKVWSDAAGVDIDDVFLLWIAPSGTASPDRSGHYSVIAQSLAKTIEIDAPSPTSLRTSYWFDDQEAGSLTTRDAPVFSPGTQALYTVAAGLADLTVSATYRPHWHTHPAMLPADATLVD